jgi:isoquinoline 1-oxidoreductase beta subunit
MTSTADIVVRATRRQFLRATGVAGGGLLLACALPPGRAGAALEAASSSELSPWLRVAEDGAITVYVEKAEMGQGVHSSLAALVAEELDVGWDDVRVEQRVLRGEGAGASTHSSSSIRRQWQPLRIAGATARQLLIDAAAEQWAVPARECVTSDGLVRHPAQGLSAAYGELAPAAAARPVPEQVELKPANEFRLIGRPLPRKDIPDKLTGRAVFGIDVQRDGMLHAAIAMSPVLGGTLVEAQRATALAHPGVRDVVELQSGAAVAVVADRYWEARKGLEALAPVFSGGEPDGSRDIRERMQEALDTPGLVVHPRPAGSPGVPAEAGRERVVTARYEVPFLAHATMEPMNCTADASHGACELWAPTQSSGSTRQAVAEALEIAPERVTVHTTLMGGGFGRRVEVDFAVQAALVSRAVAAPVKLIWSREDDMRHDYYRPACAAQLEASLDPSGRPLALLHHIAGPWHRRQLPGWLRGPIGGAQKQLGTPLVPRFLPDFVWWRFPELMRTGIAGIVAGGGAPFPYRVDDQQREYSLVECNLQLGFWRSVTGSQHAFFTESFIDELAHAAGADPYRYRRELLAPAERVVLDRAAELAGWEGTRREGRSLGIAYHSQFDTRVCQVAEVSASDARSPTVHRVFCAVDCGRVVNPDTVRAQIEGSIVFGLTAALRGQITLAAGAVEQSNFHDYPLMRLGELPQIEIELIESERSPGGIGEPATPPIAPAVANAIFAATGERLRALPIERTRA